MTLPEDLINHIFSFLSPKKLIQTSLLSKKYRTFWSTVPISTNVSFAVTNVYSMNLFLQFLRGRLLNSTATSIERLSIQWWALCESRLINTLIESALQHSVQHLHISLNLRSKGVIVRSHNLSSYTLPPVLLSAPNLKTLTLDSVRLDGWVPMTCPDLEGLVLLSCRGQFNNLKGSSLGQLRRLEVVNYRSNGNDIGSMEMEAPRLECVSYRDEYGSIECSFFGSAEGWDAVDDCFNTCRIWTRLQQGIINNAASSSSSKMCQVPLELAHHVRVSAEGIFHVLEGITSALGSLLKAYGKRIRLFELNTYFLNAASTSTQLASLLINNCCNIEVFVMQVGHRYQAPYTLKTKMAFEWPMLCNLNKLKYVAVHGVEGFDCEIEFFRLLLGSAMNFQRMVIVESASNYFKHKRVVLEQFRNQLSRQFPQARFSIQLL